MKNQFPSLNGKTLKRRKKRKAQTKSPRRTTTTNNPHLSGEENIHEFVQDEQMPLNNTDTEIEDFMSSLSLNQTITKRSSLTTMQDQEDQITSPSPQDLQMVIEHFNQNSIQNSNNNSSQNSNNNSNQNSNNNSSQNSSQNSNNSNEKSTQQSQDLTTITTIVMVLK